MLVIDFRLTHLFTASLLLASLHGNISTDAVCQLDH